MLLSLHIENYALIRESDIAFGQGFVAITGETGAGKSIMLGALGLLLGQRADASVLANHEAKCVVEAHFDISALGLNSLFEEADVDYDAHLIIRREILPSAKSRAFVNDTPVQLAFLRTLGERLVDIHSQHQTLTLSDSTFRLSLLDTLSAGQKEVPSAAYRRAYSTYSGLKKELETLTALEAESRREQDYLQFQYDELSAASLATDEQEALEAESQLLAHAEAVREGLAVAASSLDDETEASVLARLRTAKTALSHIASYHPDAEALLARIESSLIELDDVNSELLRTADAVVYSPERQQQVDERLALLYRLQQKHGVASVAELIAIRDDLDKRLNDITSLDGRIHELMEQVDKAFSAMQEAADRLTEARLAAGKRLAAGILPVLHDLGMPEARFEVAITTAASYGPEGHDVVQFLFNANRGAELHDISRIASGGEMSRLMLAVKSMLTSQTLLPTIIFDEIDTGVSGDIAGAVARTLCRMAERMQVIAITHLPQIAARASQHLKVYKHAEGEVTVSRIKELAAADRVVEVATMLSSDPPTDAAMQTARELMQ